MKKSDILIYIYSNGLDSLAPDWDAIYAAIVSALNHWPPPPVNMPGSIHSIDDLAGWMASIW